LIGTVPVSDYYDGKIKIHEKTITEKEEQLIFHIKSTGAIGEPVLLTHHPNPELNLYLELCVEQGEHVTDFFDHHRSRHELLRISDPHIIAKFQNYYARIGDLYIADGHHRSAASAGYFKQENIENGQYIACIVPPEFLRIDSFHRAYKSNDGFDPEAFMLSLMSHFEITSSEIEVTPEKEHEFGLLMGGSWYRLHFKYETKHLNSIEALDVSILEEYVFKTILDIEDSKTDPRLSFPKGFIRGNQLESEVRAGVFDLVFTLYPCNIQAIFDISDKKGIMPPKSTYIEPKLLSGLTIQVVGE
jgi:uncharacterized protein (DUF1015 family)